MDRVVEALGEVLHNVLTGGGNAAELVLAERDITSRRSGTTLPRSDNGAAGRLRRPTP
ncbi:MAG: hypothetical protein WAO83_04825 [Fuerstiella sp.]